MASPFVRFTEAVTNTKVDLNSNQIVAFKPSANPKQTDITTTNFSVTVNESAQAVRGAIRRVHVQYTDVTEDAASSE